MHERVDGQICLRVRASVALHEQRYMRKEIISHNGPRIQDMCYYFSNTCNKWLYSKIKECYSLFSSSLNDALKMLDSDFCTRISRE